MGVGSGVSSSELLYVGTGDPGVVVVVMVVIGARCVWGVGRVAGLY